MDEAHWQAIDDYFTGTLFPDDPVFTEIQRSAEEGGLPPISVSAPQGRLLHIFVRALRARRVLEVGTLAGFSATWMARGLEPGGRLVTLELDPHHADVARANFVRAGVADAVDLRVGPASESLARMREAGEGPFDLVFIDADKPGYPDYLTQALALSRPGTFIVLDNVVRDGRVLEEDSDDAAVRGTRAAIDAIGAEPRLVATAIQTVGAKGYDGFAVALVTE